MDVDKIHQDMIKRELDSFIRYCLISLVASITFFLYLVERETNENWEPETLPNISIFGLQFDHGQLIYVIFLIPILLLVLLRPIQGITDIIAKESDNSSACLLILKNYPSVFNPFHKAGTERGSLVYWMSLVLCSVVIVFFPSVSLMIWFSEVIEKDFALSTSVYSIVVLFLLFLIARALLQCWVVLFGKTESAIRLSVLLVVFISVGVFVYRALG